MSRFKFPEWQIIHTIVFDFDGIFTDNKVWVNQNGVESVKCDRADGLGLDILRKFIHLNKWNLNYFILSKEKNPVVMARASKLKIDCKQGISNKSKYLENYIFNNKLNYDGLLYLGNDLNDLPAIMLSGFSVAPCDAHHIIIEEVDYVLKKRGGEGCVRELIEVLINLDAMSMKELKNLIV